MEEWNLLGPSDSVGAEDHVDVVLGGDGATAGSPSAVTNDASIQVVVEVGERLGIRDRVARATTVADKVADLGTGSCTDTTLLGPGVGDPIGLG